VWERLSQADISPACVGTFLHESVGAETPLDSYPALRRFVSRCEFLLEFRETYVPWGAPAVR